jgi:hypothetical protein
VRDAIVPNVHRGSLVGITDHEQLCERGEVAKEARQKSERRDLLERSLPPSFPK